MIEIKYTLKLLSPLRIGTGIGKAAYLDNTIVRDTYGQPVVPGSTIKGKSRATAFRLSKIMGFCTHPASDEPNGCLVDGRPICDICRVFGAPQIPGNLFFDHAVLQKDIQKVLALLDQNHRRHNLTPQAAFTFGQHIRTNVAIDRKTHTSLSDHLFTTESVEFPIIFCGAIRSEQHASITLRDIAWLVSALQFITHLGGARGRGLGRCEITVGEALLNGNSILNQLSSLLGNKEAK